MNVKDLLSFYKGKKVLVTGNTGFKGSWLSEILLLAGAEVTGYSLAPPTEPSLFNLLGLSSRMRHITGDIRDFKYLCQVFDEVQPEIVLHLAAQPLVITSYREPRETYEINVMGTVNICECVRLHSCVKSFLNVTTDKVYHNNEWFWGYREDDPLDGYDPYSNSKSCSELVTHAYINSFYQNTAVSTARAGNVIGGGDFSENRIMPDCCRAAESGNTLIIRNPDSVRPYQHVLEPLFLYLNICAEQYNNPLKSGFFNIGPSDNDCITTIELVRLFADAYGTGFSYNVQVENNAPHEAKLLKLDTSRVRCIFGWKPVWDIKTAVKKTAEWTKYWLKGDSVTDIVHSQIKSYIEEADI